MLNILRWIVFVPAGFAAAVVVGGVFGFVGARFGEVVGAVSSGATSAAAFICVGSAVAPKRTIGIKWILISLSIVCGILAALGAALGENKVRIAVGVAMAISSLAFIRMSPEEIRGENSRRQ